MLFWPEISALGVFSNFDNEHIWTPLNTNFLPDIGDLISAPAYKGMQWPVPNNKTGNEFIGNVRHLAGEGQTT